VIWIALPEPSSVLVLLDELGCRQRIELGSEKLRVVRSDTKDDQGATQAGAAVAAARARGLSVARGVPVLRRRAAQAWRGRDRDPVDDSAPVQGDPARAREVLVSLV